jgi:APA family basic amino acid/polyamine antiporter
MKAVETQTGLARTVSRWEIVGLSINDVIGSGIYLLPAAAAAFLGGYSVWAVILIGFAVSLLVLCFAEAASYFNEPGGAYLYTREAFGRFIGFEVGWMTWLTKVAVVASLLNGFVLAVAYFWPGVTEGWIRPLVLSVPLLLFTTINVLGVKGGARTNVVLAVAKVLPLVLFVGVGLFFVDWNVITSPAAPVTLSLREGVLLLLFAYAGFENTPAAAGEYRNPQRDVPFALLTMILLVTLLYTSVQAVALGTLPGLAQSKSPLAAAAGQFVGGWAALLMTVAAVVSIAGSISALTLSGPRYLFALANDGFGPRVLPYVHPKYHTPAVAIIVQSIACLLLSLSGTFVQLALLSITARLATYVGTAAAVPVLRRRFRDRPNVLRLPGGATIPIAALLLSFVFLLSASWRNLVAGAVALLIGAVIYQFQRPRREPDRPQPATGPRLEAAR